MQGVDGEGSRRTRNGVNKRMKLINLIQKRKIFSKNFTIFVFFILIKCLLMLFRDPTTFCLFILTTIKMVI